MRKYLLAFILICCIGIGLKADAGFIPWLVGGSGCGDYSSCAAGCKVFDWECDGLDVGDDGLCTNDWGDDSFSLSTEEIAISGNKLTFTDTSANGGDYAQISCGADEIPHGDCTIEMSFNFSVIESDAEIFRTATSNNQIIISFNSTGGDGNISVVMNHRGNGNNVSKTLTTHLSLNTEYDAVFRFSTTSGLSVTVNGGDPVTNATNITTMTASPTYLNIGSLTAKNLVGTIWDVRISHGLRADL